MIWNSLKLYFLLCVTDDAGVENTSNQMSQMKGDIHTAEFIQNAFSDLT